MKVVQKAPAFSNKQPHVYSNSMSPELVVAYNRFNCIFRQLSNVYNYQTMRASDYGASSGRRVVSLSKIHLPPKSTGNTQEAVSPSGND